MVAGGSGAVSGAIAQDERVVVYVLLVRWAAPQTAVDGCVSYVQAAIQEEIQFLFQISQPLLLGERLLVRLNRLNR